MGTLVATKTPSWGRQDTVLGEARLTLANENSSHPLWVKVWLLTGRPGVGYVVG